MTMTRTSWSRERSCERSSPCWRCTWVEWSPPSSSSTRCGARSRRRRCETGCRASRRSCGERWGRPTSSPCVATATPSSCRPTPSTCTGTSSWSRRGRRRAAEGDLSRAVDLLAEADALWRGDPLADFAYEDFAAAAITRLSELRLAVIEERLDLELQLGRHQGAIVPLEELVDRASASRAPPRPADDRPVPRRTAGRRAPGLPGGPQHPRRGARSRAGPRAAPAGVGDPRPGPDPSMPRRSTRPHRAVESRSTIPESLTPLGRPRRGAARPHAPRSPTIASSRSSGPVEWARPGSRSRSARLESADLPFGGCLVELAPVGDPAGVRAAIASALDLPDPSRLAEVIGDREVLLVLDNCEHVIADRRRGGRGASCAAARACASSPRAARGCESAARPSGRCRRSRRTTPSSSSWPAPPTSAHRSSPPTMTSRSSPTSAPASTGCPSPSSSPPPAPGRSRSSTSASRLNDRFRLLTGGSRTALPRQQTLRAVVDWSYELLFDDEQRVFERLAVFPGGCDLATAEAVCADDTLAAARSARHHPRARREVARPRGAERRRAALHPAPDARPVRPREARRTGRRRGVSATPWRRTTPSCAPRAPAAYTGERQRAWLTAIDQEHDNLRAALEWAVANDDAETALTIAGGASWPHWLAGTVVEGRRWLDDAFACGGEADERTRALALTGRGLLDFLAGSPDRADDDLEAALAIFRAPPRRRRRWRWRTPSTPSSAAARGDVDEARRRRRERARLLRRTARGPVRDRRPRLLAGEARHPRRRPRRRPSSHYRAAAEGFCRLDRPVMHSMCLGMVADFDERAGDYAAAIRTPRGGDRDQRVARLGGFTGFPPRPPRMGAAPRRATSSAPRRRTSGRSSGARRLQDTCRFCSSPWPGWPPCTGSTAATARRAPRPPRRSSSTWRASPRRFRNRIDPQSDVLVGAAACCSVLAVLAAEADEPERAARLLGQAERLRHDADAPVPAFQREDLDRARATATAMLGEDAFLAAYEQGRRGELGARWPSRPERPLGRLRTFGP